MWKVLTFLFWRSTSGRLQNFTFKTKKSHHEGNITVYIAVYVRLGLPYFEKQKSGHWMTNFHETKFMAPPTINCPEDTDDLKVWETLVYLIVIAVDRYSSKSHIKQIFLLQLFFIDFNYVLSSFGLQSFFLLYTTVDEMPCPALQRCVQSYLRAGPQI